MLNLLVNQAASDHPFLLSPLRQVDDDVTFVYQELECSRPMKGDQLSHFRKILRGVELSHELKSPKMLLEAVPLREQSVDASALPDLDDLWLGGGPFPTRVSWCTVEYCERKGVGDRSQPSYPGCTRVRKKPL